MSSVRLVIAAAVFAIAAPAVAQNWTFDARKIGMGNAGGSDNPASRLIDEERGYRAVVLPFGLLQVLRDADVFDPDSDHFDIVRAVEYAASPLHFTLQRNTSDSDAGRQLSVDIRNGRLSRDLNDYRGFVPAQQPVAEGLTQTTFGVTIPVVRGANGMMHGLYVGAGPYLSMRSSLALDDRFIGILASETDVYLPNSRFDLGLASRGQMAVALTGGYRARVPLAGTSGERDGVYVALDYNYLLGFRYEDTTTALALDTDNAGLLTFTPASLVPLRIGRDHSSSGRGFAIDVGVGVVAERIEAGVGVKGIANRIDWSDVERSSYGLANLFTGSGDFIEAGPVPIDDVRVELPRDVRVYGGYRTATGFAVVDLAHGFNGTSLHGGYEHHLGFLDLRGGGLRSRGMWQPTAGIGLNMGRRVALDLAMFGTAANVERKRKAAIAVSLRFSADGE